MANGTTSGVKTRTIVETVVAALIVAAILSTSTLQIRFTRADEQLQNVRGIVKGLDDLPVNIKLLEQSVDQLHRQRQEDVSALRDLATAIDSLRISLIQSRTRGITPILPAIEDEFR